MKSLTLFSALLIFLPACCCSLCDKQNEPSVWGKKGYSIPIIDLDTEYKLHSIVDKEKGQYLGHPSTYLQKNGDIIVVYPKGHGRGAVQMKKSTDGGKTWSERLLTPASWATSNEVPTLYPTVDSAGKERLLMITGMAKFNRLAVSEDDGNTWSELKNIPTQAGGIVAYGDMIPLKTGKGHYMGAYHSGCSGTDSEGRFGSLEQYVCFTEDGGLTWSKPQVVLKGTRRMHPCEGGLVRSPDGKTIAMLLRENSRHVNSLLITSMDEGKTWSTPKELPAALAGDRHQAIYLPDGRLFIQFRDISASKNPDVKLSPTEGDWVGWVGTFDDIINGREGEYRVRIKDNCNGWDTAYPCAELLKDGTIVCTTYGHFSLDHTAYVMTVRAPISLLDQKAKEVKEAGSQPIKNVMGKDKDFIFDPNDPDAINAKIKGK